MFDKLTAIGFTGSDRTTRRALASVKLNWKAGRRRVYRPWVVEPGMWAQWDWGHGPKIAGRQTYLICAWLAWSRFRVVIPVWDKTLPTVIACLDRSMRLFGGVPTYWLTDNERTVSTGHIAGIAVRHPLIVEVGHHYGVTIATCVPADPETKGGVERTPAGRNYWPLTLVGIGAGKPCFDAQDQRLVDDLLDRHDPGVDSHRLGQQGQLYLGAFLMGAGVRSLVRVAGGESRG